MNAALVGFCALAYWWRRKRSVEVLGFFWILVAYAPSWIIPNSDLFSESRLYLPFAGFSLVVTSPLVGRGDLKSWCWRRLRGDAPANAVDGSSVEVRLFGVHGRVLG